LHMYFADVFKTVVLVVVVVMHAEELLRRNGAFLRQRDYVGLAPQMTRWTPRCIVDPTTTHELHSGSVRVNLCQPVF